MERFGGTLADTIEPGANLPIWLQFETHPEDGIENMYESAYDESSAHLFETKGASQAVRTFVTSEPEENWTWEKFNDGYNDVGVGKSDFNGYIKWFKANPDKINPAPKPSKASAAAEEEVDDRPEWDPNAEGIDPRLAKLIAKKAEEADDKVQSVKEVVDEKYYAIYDVARRIANGRGLKHHAFICGDAGVGKSYSVGKAVEKGLEEFKPNRRQPTKPELFMNYGSIGASMSNILMFFYEHRENQLLVLDDADGFLKMTDQDVQNFLKAILDPNMHPVTTSVTARAYANNLLRKQWAATQKALGESTEYPTIYTDMSRLPEGIAMCSVNGTDITWNVESFDEAKKLSKMFASKALRESWLKKAGRLQEDVGYSKPNPNSKYFKQKMYEADVVEDDFDYGEDDGLSDEERRILSGLGDPSDDMLDTECPEIPASWQFMSNLILISNLRMADINEAVKSRCQCVELTLTKEEFLCRAEEIIDNIDVGAEDSSNDPETVEWAKRESFAIFKSIIAATGFRNTGFDDIKINIPLEFRLVAAFTGEWLARYDRWLEKNGMEDSPEAKKRAEDEILLPFVKYGMKPILAGDTRLKKKK